MKFMVLMSDIKNTYNELAKLYDSEFDDIYFLSELNYFLELLPKKSKIIDLGCGTGIITKHVENKGFEVTGIDFSENMLLCAKEKCKKSKFIEADIEDYNYGKESFDGILASFILIHIKKENTEKLLSKIHGSLKNSGLLFLAVMKGSKDYYGPEPLNPKLNMYFSYRKKEEILNQLEKTGFQILKYKEILRKTKSMEYTGMFIIAKKV